MRFQRADILVWLSLGIKGNEKKGQKLGVSTRGVERIWEKKNKEAKEKIGGNGEYMKKWEAGLIQKKQRRK